MIKKTVEVTQYVDVEIDETRFTPDFMVEFRNSFYPFHDLDDHIKHIAQLEARGMVGWGPDAFIEGYGRQGDFGITATVVGQEEEIER